VHSLAQSVLTHIRRQELLKAGDRVGVAVSGGIDSVALLRLLLELRGELGIVLSVVHFNHKLRAAESDADQEFVAELARLHDLQFHCDSDDVAQHAAEEHTSVEAAARELRYGFFQYLLGEDRDSDCRGTNVKTPTSGNTGQKWGTRYTSSLDKIATGHTLDDQAETVLMRMVRGSGLRGLAGIYPRIPVEDEQGEICGEIVRPLLGIRRRELETYLNDIGQCWREDATNTDTALTRNRVRKLVVPLLERELNPGVAENLAELAEISRGEQDYWENEVAGWMGTVVHWSEPDWARADTRPPLIQIEPQHGSELNARSLPGKERDASRSPRRSFAAQQSLAQEDSLNRRIASAPWPVMNASVSRLWLVGEGTAAQRRLVKAIGEHARIPLEFKHVEEILRFAAQTGSSGKDLSLPLGWKVACEADELVFLTPDLRQEQPASDYEYELAVPGWAVIHETGCVIEARYIPAGAETGYNPQNLLDAEALPGPLRVRNWRAGDRFWPAHTKSPKKIKELLQERRVAQPERRLWPVVVNGDEIVWVRGFSGPARLRPKPGRAAVMLVETLLARPAH
jgi:tRNA(Ile)-lysidine synthase